eukprot:CAMPEP_0197830498 /NCGR_PEP_ID=MMETSP1437-20131217/7105_1 /TAXON_ID=49252 ORGANISM="Eucampia antarctica, Strain CCMP1452" /NCGR_SAMPLE_ID=MMETSP1437 /ASSEMBLY_ACC=CAM_ASM_001096 /LENGTH=953 /DNA_ID=CAMNT_0043432935 /DNA_START=191 /DNA_END=3052 /DNA_ORIENTATION=+
MKRSLSTSGGHGDGNKKKLWRVRLVLVAMSLVGILASYPPVDMVQAFSSSSTLTSTAFLTPWRHNHSNDRSYNHYMTATTSSDVAPMKRKMKGKPRYKSKFKNSKKKELNNNNNKNPIDSTDSDQEGNTDAVVVTTSPKKEQRISVTNNNSNDDDGNDIMTPKSKMEVTKLFVVNPNNSKLKQTPAELRRSRNRLSKARALLEDFETYDPMDESAIMQTDSIVASENDSDYEEDAQKEKETTTTVPDTVWYNSNLISNKSPTSQPYVTRWAKGVKVAEPLVKYDPVEAEKLLFSQPTKWLVRNVQIAAPLSWYVTAVLFDIVTGREIQNRPKRARQLLTTLSGLGPAIIKGGQALASRSDLLPSEYLEELQKLQDDVPRYSNDLAFKTVEEDLKIDSFDEVFELIEPEPIAAASIGQVYKARLVSNPDIVVALKIQRPNCESVIALDLYVLRWWSGVFNTILQGLFKRDIDLQSIIDDFGELIYRELDYVAEAANAQRFNELYAGKVKDIFVPKVYSELTTSKVLTMEWVDGFRLTDTKNLEAYGLDRKKLVDTLVQCSLRQILETGLIHVDPHAGNLLACEDGRLCYLDFGMISYADSRQRNGFLLAVVHIVNRDWGELVRLYQRLGFIPEGTDLQPIEVALERALPDVLNSAVSELNFKNVVNKLGDIMYTYPFSLPPFYISIIRCLGVLEGLAIQVDPDARIIKKAYPYVANRVLTDPQDELQEALRRLALTNDGHIRWSRLEGLLEKAKDSQGYDVTVALDQLSNYLISDDGESLLSDLADQIVEGADSLGAETGGYVLEASKALVINDEVGALRAFRALQKIVESQNESSSGISKENSDNDDDDDVVVVEDEMADLLPELTPSMKQFWSIATLLGARGSQSDPSKFIPLIRKLAQEPKIQRIASEVVARLGERILSRSLRAAFGLPQPTFDNKEGSSSKKSTVRQTVA